MLPRIGSGNDRVLPDRGIHRRPGAPAWGPRRAPPPNPASAGSSGGSVEAIQRFGDGRRSGDEDRLADALGPEWALRLRFFHEDRLHGRHASRRDDAQGLEGEGDREPVADDELLAQGTAQAHVDPALDLALHQGPVQDATHIVRGDHPLDPAVAVQDDDLRRPTEGEMGDRLGDVRAKRRRPIDGDLALELTAGKRLQGTAGEFGAKRGGGLQDRSTAEHRGPRGGRLSGVELAFRVHEDDDAVEWDAKLGRRQLGEHRVAALAHLGPGVIERERAVSLGPEDRATVFADPVADP